METVSDFVIKRIAAEGVKTVFTVSGDGNIFLTDALGRNLDLKYVCNHHEQACVMAAEGLQKASGDIGVALIASGPAATNALTGVVSAWNDQVPLLVISGQADSTTLVNETGLRQRGVQEVNIAEMVSSVTKYAATVTDASTIKHHLDKALFLAKNAPFGPVWLDIPIDIQCAKVNPNTLKQFLPKEEDFIGRQPVSRRIMETVLAELGYSNRPVVLLGNGVRLAHAEEEFLQFVERTSIPVVTTKNAFDLIPYDHPLLAGRIGIYGQRAANLAVQNADLLIVFGSRLTFPSIGHDPKLFARAAMKIVVDINPIQLQHMNIEADLKIHADCAVFLEEFNNGPTVSLERWGEWRETCATWKRRYPTVPQSERVSESFVNPNYFFEVLSEEMAKTDALVCGQGTAFHSFSTAFKNQPGQRVITNGGFAPMGFGLPAAIGACFSREVKTVVCVEGDGSLQMNLGALQTMAHHRLPLKLFVFSNGGYVNTARTHREHFDGRTFGTDPESGVSFPNAVRLGEAHRIHTATIETHETLRETIQKTLRQAGPAVVEVMLDPKKASTPRVISLRNDDGVLAANPLELMSPELPADVLRDEMIVPPVEE